MPGPRLSGVGGRDSLPSPWTCRNVLQSSTGDHRRTGTPGTAPRIFGVSVKFKNWTRLGEVTAPIRKALKNAGFRQRDHFG